MEEKESQAQRERIMAKTTIPRELTPSMEKFIKQHPYSRFLGFIQVENQQEEFFETRDDYIHRLEELWCEECNIAYKVLLVQ